MTERTMMILIHVGLFLLQIAAVGLAIGVNSTWSAMSAPISLAQAFFPNPFRAP